MDSRRDFLRTAGGAALLASLGDQAWLRAAHGGTGSCAGSTLTTASINAFRKSIAGELILPADAAYGSARLVYNRRFSPRPMMIVRAASESDVARTIAFARETGVRLATRSGGHSYIGASGGGGIVLDLRLLNQVAPLGGARFTVGAGTRLVRVYGELACNGNWTIPCGSCDSVGFGGIALGGGFGYLQRTHGLTCDRVRAIRMIDADGGTRIAAPDGDADLYWALRGGAGGSFGVATSFEIEAVPLETIHVMGWRWPLAAADDALARFHDLVATDAMPRHTLGAVVFNIDTGAATPACLGLVFSTGSLAETAAARAQLVGPGGVPAIAGSDFAFDAQSPVCDPVEPRGFESYKAKSSIVYAPPAPGAGAAVVAGLARRIADPRFALSEYASVNFLSLGGAASDVAPEATAFPHRAALSEVQYLGYWNGGGTAQAAAKERANIDWLRGLYADVAPRLSLGGAGCYANYADDDLAESEWPSLYFGANYPRLQAVKQAVDPTDFFRGLQSVRLPS